ACVLCSPDACGGNCPGHSGSPATRRIVVATGQPGSMFPPPMFSERLEALTPTRITVVSTDHLSALLTLPRVAEGITDALIEAARQRQETIRNCAYVRHSERVVEKLVQLAR